jgi:hypothetical protein
MSTEQARRATQPYRVRAGEVWYWVDPAVAAEKIEPGDTVVVYPVAGEASVAILQSRLGNPGAEGQSVTFSTLGGEPFTVSAQDIAALHLAASDEEQT